MRNQYYTLKRFHKITSLGYIVGWNFFSFGSMDLFLRVFLSQACDWLYKTYTKMMMCASVMMMMLNPVYNHMNIFSFIRILCVCFRF